MCKKDEKNTKAEFFNFANKKLGGIGALPETFQGLFNIWAKKGGRIILAIAKTEEIDPSSAENFETIVEVGGGAVPHLKVNGICSAESFNGGISQVVEIGDKRLTIKGGAITKVEDKNE